ncbi:MAG: hypothetical protein JW795_11775 [Chitinivibrionales bacterium]|nr:hypothetical protein [Chitinivibrionales bacterium]
MKKGLILIDIQNDYFPGGNMELAGIGASRPRNDKKMSFRLFFQSISSADLKLM